MNKYSKQEATNINGKIVTIQHDAPLPPPSELASYERVRKGLADIIIGMAQNEQSSMIEHVKQSDQNRKTALENQKFLQELNFKIAKKQLLVASWLSIPIVLMAVIFAITGMFFLYQGKTIEGAILVAPTFLSVSIKFFINLVVPKK